LTAVNGGPRQLDGAAPQVRAENIDGKPVRSRMLQVGAIRNRAIEGVGATPSGAKVQKAWLDLEVIQCGCCQPSQGLAQMDHLAARRVDRNTHG
jgi:aerobic-type carbon monoxide dehydrogenase small subunit (CoxS/CutS family)